MVRASGNAWEYAINKFQLTSDDLLGMSEWVTRQYFSEKHAKKPWYKPGVTPETALMEILSPQSPISPIQISDIWKLLPSINLGLGRKDLSDSLLAVQTYLERDQDSLNIPTYNKGDATLSEMSEEFGNITSTMVNKIFVSAARKLRELTGGISPAEMDRSFQEELKKRVDTTRKAAALEYASALKASQGDIQAFLDGQLALRHLSKMERAAVSQDEIEILSVLETLEIPEIEQALLTDIQEDENIFLTFQNAASKKLFPNRAGRPKGSKPKKNQEVLNLTEDLDEDEIPEAILDL